MLTCGVSELVVLHGEYLHSIEWIHVVDSKDEVGLLEVKELVVVDEDVLGAAVWVAKGLWVHIQEGSCLHIQVGAIIEGVVAQYEVVHGSQVKEVVESLVVVAIDQGVLHYYVGSDLCCIISSTVPSIVVPKPILIISEIDV